MMRISAFVSRYVWLGVLLVLVGGLMVLALCWEPPGPADQTTTDVVASALTPATPMLLPGLVVPASDHLTVTPTATKRPTPTLTPTASPTVTPSHTPTVTPLPSQWLAKGLRHLRNGNYQAAIKALQAFLQDAPDSPNAPKARYRLGEAGWKANDAVVAVAAFEAFLADPPELAPDGQIRHAHFLLAQAYAAAGNPIAAIHHYRIYVDGGGVLASLAERRIAQAFEQAGNFDDALAAYRTALVLAPDWESTLEVRWALAGFYLRHGQYSQALSQYDAIIAAGPSRSLQAKAHFRAGQAHQAAGDRQQAAVRFHQAMSTDAKSQWAYKALKALLSMGLADQVGEYLRGLIDFYNGAYEPAIRAFWRYLDNTPDHDASAHDYAARAMMKTGNYWGALKEYQKIIDTHRGDQLWGQAWLGKAKALRRLGDDAAAEKTYWELIHQYPNDPAAAQALWELGQMAERARDYQTATDVYTRLATSYPAAALADDALFRAGLAEYRQEHYQPAMDHWRRLWSTYPTSDWIEAARFWMGRALLDTGEDQAAVRAWQPLVSTGPERYYAQRALAAAAKAGLHLSVPPLTPVIEGSDDAQAAAEIWLRTWIADARAGPLATLPADIAQDAQWQRGQEYLALGLRAEGLQELNAVRRRWWHDPLALYQLALAFRDVGAYQQSIRCAERLLELAPLSLKATAPRFLLELAYPTYYADLVMSEAREQGVDPWLLFAVIRQESMFEAGATSWAAAHGLMQVIPSTGELIARQLGWDGFRSRDLYLPYVSVKFGTRYLAQAFHRFDGRLVDTLAGYNAGPGNAEFWRRQNGPDDDLFVETISLTETRIYVRAVLQQYGVYRWLYGSQG